MPLSVQVVYTAFVSHPQDNLLVMKKELVCAGPKSGSQLSVPAAKSDDVAEKTIACLQALLEACSCASDEVLPIVERCCPILELPPDCISEEVSLLS